MNELVKILANGLTRKQGEAVLAIATEIGNRLGDFINNAIDDAFDKLGKGIKENA